MQFSKPMICIMWWIIIDFKLWDTCVILCYSYHLFELHDSMVCYSSFLLFFLLSSSNKLTCHISLNCCKETKGALLNAPCVYFFISMFLLFRNRGFTQPIIQLLTYSPTSYGFTSVMFPFWLLSFWFLRFILKLFCELLIKKLLRRHSEW